MTKKYSCVFFDLDHTLWDYESNSKETLIELHEQYNLRARGIMNEDEWVAEFRKVNIALWDLYDRALITSEVIREERFKQILNSFNAFDQDLSDNLSRDYLAICPMKCNLMPHAIETLEYLRGKYTLTVVTNGFDDVQYLKLAAGKLTPYFDHIVTSQRAGHRKPSREIFTYALRVSGARSEEAIMIGDNPVTDIGGALNASIDAVLFNPEQLLFDVRPHYEIKALRELQQIL